jgi:CheY-like chemotaxis protein
MDDETLHEVSKPYVSHNRERGGNGLGLPMVIEMVQQRDGAVDIDSQPDEGTCVSVLLPRPESNHDSDDDSDSGDEEGDDPTDGSDHILARLLHGPSNRPKILLVDDNPPIRTFMRYYIEQHGFEVLDAENARDARGILEETSSIDLMIVDTVLPTRRGPDLARDLHERGLTAPVLYYSKHSFSDLVESGYLSADDPFLDDPLKAGELIDTIEKLFDGGPDGPTCRRRATG